MSARYYVTGSGAYLGAFDGAPPPAGAVEVVSPPLDARATWNGEGWDEPTPIQRYSRAAMIEALSAEEAATFEAALNGATAQQRMIWTNSPDVLNSANPAWPGFVMMLEQTFGAERAAEILNAARSALG